MEVASLQTSFGIRLSRIHFWMRDKRTPKDVCGEANMEGVATKKKGRTTLNDP